MLRLTALFRPYMPILELVPQTGRFMTMRLPTEIALAQRAVTERQQRRGGAA